MGNDIWPVLVILTTGSLILLIGFLRERHLRAIDKRRLSSPPPTMAGGDASPDYILPFELETNSPDDHEPAVIPDDAPCIPSGLLDDVLLAQHHGQCTAKQPGILIVTDPVTDRRDIQTILFAGGRRHTPTVIVAPSFSEEALQTFSVNNAAGTSTFFPIALSDGTEVRRVASYTGAGALTHLDIAADWIPADAWGSCALWISDTDNSWIILATQSTPE